MKKFTTIYFILLLNLLTAIQINAYGYGYAKEEDPLIKVFKAVIFCERQANWEKISHEVNMISDHIDDIYAIFKINRLSENATCQKFRC
ncbi:hypothetical protein B188_25710 [Candidatus Brocadiaceae bacterium B188]|nr:hypothetical protein [Candidatus Brocadia sapporoensis]QQR65812.1 MAG: hypothetical protein IPI25_09595 [Candidatus Brocadia sp.]RZV59689.1 MAG: hypothetical protein EX330_00485 [Candidatus Brocadia sp. BROELEC01]TWU50141.1 hypothetical protein B188_25710 [Candidatus Brocadiaceae bacterium B188]